MARQNRTKGFTHADVSALVLLGLFLLATAPLACRQLRSECSSGRLTCGANLSEIGRAMLIYANDYEGEFPEFPRAGGPTTTWGPTVNWMAPDRRQAFGLAADYSRGSAGISASLYLLVKYMEVMPKYFVCPSDAGTTEFNLSDIQGLSQDFDLADAWDFGPHPEASTHCSYAYHIPYGHYRLTATTDPSLAVAADRNPWIKSPAADPADFTQFRPDVPPYNGTAEQARAGNAIAHQNDGQNVLFVDGHVSFQARAYCGIDQDNIYTISDQGQTGSPLGFVPPLGSRCVLANKDDSVLVHDPDVFVYGIEPPRRRR